MNTSYIIDRNGKAKAVVVSYRHYQKLLRLIEDLEDALEIKRAKISSSKLIPEGSFIRRLKERHLI